MITRLPCRRAFHPIISKCWQQPLQRQVRISRALFQQRQYSELPSTPQGSSTSSPSLQQTPRPNDLRSQFEPTIPPAAPKRKRSLRPWIFAALCLLVGSTAGQYVSLVLAPPALPAPFTNEDKLMVDFLHSRAENLPIVKSLLADPAFESWEAYSTLAPEERSKRLTTGALAGARGLGGYQRIFHNAATGELIVVVWFGGAVAGWPGVTHGGLIATVLDETLGRCAIMQFPSKTGVTANLELNYLKPSVTNEFYVVRAIPVKDGRTDKKAWVQGRLETLDGKICVEAKALFVVPKTYATREIKEDF